MVDYLDFAMAGKLDNEMVRCLAEKLVVMSARILVAMKVAWLDYLLVGMLEKLWVE